MCVCACVCVVLGYFMCFLVFAVSPDIRYHTDEMILSEI